MSSPERRAVLKAQREAAYVAEEAERHRRAGLSMFERIDEAKDLEDIKEILREIARAKEASCEEFEAALRKSEERAAELSSAWREAAAETRTVLHDEEPRLARAIEDVGRATLTNEATDG